MAATLTDPLIGQVVDGRYQVLSRIARGGMATVYLANDRRLDREVALKVMHAHLAEGGAGSEFVARFRREARAAARLTHPGLVGVFDQGVDGDTSYLTMEYIDGTNLRRHIGEQGALTVAEAFSIAESVLDALAAAHRAGLVHRDVKPENVLLATDGRVKVADFGLARAVTEVTSTTTGTVLGTVAYLAPELVAHGASDPRTDVYAVGILLYEMLTGTQPFTGETPIQVAYQHVNSDIPDPSGRLDWLPVEVDELVGALAARDPADRPNNAAAALEHVRSTRGRLDEATLERRADVEPTIVLPGATGGLVVPDPDRTDDSDSDGAAAEPAAEAEAETAGGDPDATQRLAVPDQQGRDQAEDGDVPPGSTMALRIGTGLPEQATPAPGAEPADQRWRRRVTVLLSVVAVAALSGIIAIWYAVYGPGAYTSVPAGLVGATLEDAQTRLAAEQLGVRTDDDFHPDIPEGSVIATSPEEGGQIIKEGTVELTVSLGPDLREVPAELEGSPTQEAVAALTDAGFDVPEPETEHHDSVEAEHVISVSAEAGEELPVGTEVAVVSSLGPAPVTVKSVTGLERDEAVELLEGDGLRVEVTEEYTEDYEEYPEGRVMDQSPEPGTEGHRTDTVTLTVSLGAPLVEVPDVFRMQFDEARELLQERGFEVERENLIGGVFGTVRDQDPEAGEEARMGSTITLRVV